jgi:hypothetical protein
MAKGKKFRLDAYDPQGRVIASCADHYATALLMSLNGEGSSIRYKNAILWIEGADGEGAESYDDTIAKVYDRLGTMVKLV